MMKATEQLEVVYHNDLICMFVLDVLRHDVAEQVSSILKMLNNNGCIGWREHWSGDFTDQEVVAALKRLAQDGLVSRLEADNETGELRPAKAEINDGRMEEMWFSLTDEGHCVWDTWKPPADPEQGLSQ